MREIKTGLGRCRVRKGTAYPSTLLISANNDDRVDPMHARKMTAALQRATSAGHPILLRTYYEAAHVGSGMKKQLVEEYAERLAFLMNEMGFINEHQGSVSPAGGTISVLEHSGVR